MDNAFSVWPEEVVLDKGERMLCDGSFRATLFTPYLKVNIALTSKRIWVKSPNFVWGYRFSGYRKVSYQVADIASVSTRTTVSVRFLVVGILAVLAFFSFAREGGALLAALLALYCFLNSRRAEFVFTDRSGRSTEHRIRLFDRQEAQEFADRINVLLAGARR